MPTSGEIRRWEAQQSGNLAVLAKDPTTSVQQLNDIAMNASARLVTMVASNQATPGYLLDNIWEARGTQEIALRLLRNRNTPMGTVHKIMNSEYGRYAYHIKALFERTDTSWDDVKQFHPLWINYQGQRIPVATVDAMWLQSSPSLPPSYALDFLFIKHPGLSPEDYLLGSWFWAGKAHEWYLKNHLPELNKHLATLGYPQVDLRNIMSLFRTCYKYYRPNSALLSRLR